jgi:hypothetical protein
MSRRQMILLWVRFRNLARQMPRFRIADHGHEPQSVLLLQANAL